MASGAITMLKSIATLNVSQKIEHRFLCDIAVLLPGCKTLSLPLNILPAPYSRCRHEASCGQFTDMVSFRNAKSI